MMVVLVEVLTMITVRILLQASTISMVIPMPFVDLMES